MSVTKTPNQLKINQIHIPNTTLTTILSYKKYYDHHHQNHTHQHHHQHPHQQPQSPMSVFHLTLIVSPQPV